MYYVNGSEGPPSSTTETPSGDLLVLAPAAPNPPPRAYRRTPGESATQALSRAPHRARHRGGRHEVGSPPHGIRRIAATGAANLSSLRPTLLLRSITAYTLQIVASAQ